MDSGFHSRDDFFSPIFFSLHQKQMAFMLSHESGLYPFRFKKRPLPGKNLTAASPLVEAEHRRAEDCPLDSRWTALGIRGT